MAPVMDATTVAAEMYDRSVDDADCNEEGDAYENNIHCIMMRIDYK